MRSIVCLTAIAALLLAACSERPAADQVADQFVRAYFVQNDMAGAVALASGQAKADLATVLQEIEASGAKEPAKDVPRVKVSLVDRQTASADAVRFVYRIDPEVAQVQPITATLRLSKEGSRWFVSEFSQTP